MRSRVTPFVACTILLGLALTLVYGPPGIGLPIRTTGDEKVYIAQAVEMARDGLWFQQRLFGEANYYKGPLHYLLLRLGMKVFGPHAPLALWWMNLTGTVILAFTLARVVRRRLPVPHGADLLAAAVVACSFGGYSHALASQMESLLIVVYGLFMCALAADSERPERPLGRVAAFAIAGVAAWLKSPVNAVLLVSSAAFFWWLRGALWTLARRPREWGFLGLGVGIGVAGYLPAAVGDSAAFWQTFVAREMLSKGANGVTLDEALLPFFSAHLLPWTPLLIAFLPSLFRLLSTGRTESRRLTQLAIAVALPTVAFFVAHPYRNGIYILPILPAMALAIAVGWQWAAANGRRSLSVATQAVAVIPIVASLTVAALVLWLTPWPAWWGQGTTAWTVGTAAAAATVLLWACRSGISADRRAALLVTGQALLLGGVGAMLVALQAHEAFDVRVATSGSHRPAAAAWYRLNLNQHLWAETGLLNFLFDHDIKGIESPTALSASLGAMQVYLSPDDAQLASLRAAVAQRPELRLQVIPWRRWRIHGEDEHGQPLWQQALATRSLAPLEREEFIGVVESTAANEPRLLGGGA